MSAFGFGPFQTTAVSSTKVASQTSTMVPGWQILSPGPQSVSTGSAALGSTLLPPFCSESSDGVTMIIPGRAEDLGPETLPLPQQAVRVPGQGHNDLESAPAVPTEGQVEVAPACDACFLDEVSMALVAEQTLALASGDTEASPELRGSGLALLGVFASSLWMVPDRTEESRKRRGSLLWPSR